MNNKEKEMEKENMNRRNDISRLMSKLVDARHNAESREKGISRFWEASFGDLAVAAMILYDYGLTVSLSSETVISAYTGGVLIIDDQHIDIYRVVTLSEKLFIMDALSHDVEEIRSPILGILYKK
jgi:hypothetical protein